MYRFFAHSLFLLCSLVFGCACVASPKIAIIIDDLGLHKTRDRQAIQLPAALTYAFLPFERYTNELANYAHLLNKEVILHLPMQSLADRVKVGKHGLTANMDDNSVQQTVQADLAAIPFVKGVNNHMGSLITQNQRMLQLVMAELNRQHLYFIDSFTTVDSKARSVAKHAQLATDRRDIFLDTIDNPHFIRYQINNMLALAKKRGHVVAIAHPYANTLQVLEQALPEIQHSGFQLVTVSDLLLQQPDVAEPSMLAQQSATTQQTT